MKNTGSKMGIILSVRCHKLLEEKKKNSKRQKALKTVNTFDGGKCTMLIKISDCLGISDCMEFVTLKSITASKHLKASKLVLRALAQAYSGSVSSQG